MQAINSRLCRLFKLVWGETGGIRVLRGVAVPLVDGGRQVDDLHLQRLINAMERCMINHRILLAENRSSLEITKSIRHITS